MFRKHKILSINLMSTFSNLQVLVTVSTGCHTRMGLEKNKENVSENSSYSCKCRKIKSHCPVEMTVTACY